MSDLFENHIVGFPTRWLISVSCVCIPPLCLITLGCLDTKSNVAIYDDRYMYVRMYVTFTIVNVRSGFSSGTIGLVTVVGPSAPIQLPMVSLVMKWVQW